MKVVYENTARDFQTITDEKERSILFEYSERGRSISLGFISKSSLLILFDHALALDSSLWSQSCAIIHT